MNLQFTQEENAFREEVRTWLAENTPRARRPIEGREMREFDLAWQRAQFDGGWAGIVWPVEYGGRGLSLTQQLIWFEEYGKAEAPPIGSCFVGINHGGPTLIEKGSAEQKESHLPAILRGEEVWCQGFSEPGAGSDLAGISTRGVIDGDVLIVNGQKVWTSYANVADFQELVVRTSTEDRRHDGLTWIICDMKSDGIEVRPLRTMAGNTEFCEVFYADVRIPLTNVVGAIGGGWKVAMSTLSFERGTSYLAEQVRLSQEVDSLVDFARSTPATRSPGSLIDDGAIASRLAALRSEVSALKALTYSAISRWEHSGAPGVEGSIVRLYHSELLQRVFAFGMELRGWDALAIAPDEYDGSWTRTYLDSYATTIVGGTSDIQRNIIGERLLGLPRDRP